MEEESNKLRKAKQRASYHAEFKPHQKPRSRRWTIKKLDPRETSKKK